MFNSKCKKLTFQTDTENFKNWFHNKSDLSFTGKTLPGVAALSDAA